MVVAFSCSPFLLYYSWAWHTSGYLAWPSAMDATDETYLI